MDKEQMKQPPQPWEFRSKPAWQRLIIMLGGVTMNVVLAIVIYIGLLSYFGEEYLHTQQVNKYGVTVDSLSYQMGFRNGDKILDIGGKQVTNFQKIPIEILLNEAHNAQVIRDNDTVTLNFPQGSLNQMLKARKQSYFLAPRFPFIIGEFGKNSVAEKAGLHLNDTILGFNGQYIKYFTEFRNSIQEHKNQTITVIAKRGADTLQIPVHLGKEGLLGVYAKTNLGDFFKLDQKRYNFFQAIPAGFERTWQGIDNYLKQLRLIFSPKVKAYENVGGFITIGSIFPSVWHWESFWRLTAFLSIMLAILNILPIPALDGGHVLFLMYEIIARRKPSDKFLEYAQVVGMIILFSLLILANGNDILKLFRN
jgi:regulator of sigma E protease